jgi:hypothetical protein
MLATQPDVQSNELAEAIRVARLRLVANRWMSLSLISLNGLLIGLVLAAALLSGIRPVLVAGAVLAVVASVVCALFVWQARPSSYDVAQRLDSESRLGDRISTAIHFWEAPSPGDVVLRQRQDALDHLAQADPMELFPFKLPANSWRTAALFAIFLAASAYHSAYGPLIPRLTEKAAQSRAVASILSPISRAFDLARGEKKEFADLIASNDRDRQSATENQRPVSLPTAGQPDAAAKAVENSPALNMIQDLQMANADSSSLTQGANTPVQPGQQAAVPSNAQSGTASDRQQAGQQQAQSGQQSLAERALQALANLMGSSASDSQQNSNGTPPPSLSSAPTAGATSTQSTSGNSQAANAAAQAAQGQTSNSETSQNQSLTNPGKHTGAGNGASPWQPHAADDPQLAGNTAKEYLQLQTTGYRGEPGKERSDVALGTAQIPLQNVAPQTVTTINGAGQDSVPPRYRQYVQDYFQHSGK